MDSTSPSLLDRLREPDEQEAWDRFADIYTPFLYHCARRIGLSPEEAGDLVQEIFLVLLEKLPKFTYDPERSFRSWLRTVTLNKWREHQRRKSASQVNATPEEVANLEAPDLLAAFEEKEYLRHVLGHALELVKGDVAPETAQMFEAYVLQGQSAKQVAEQFNVSESAVYVARHRMLHRLRQYLNELL